MAVPKSQSNLGVCKIIRRNYDSLCAYMMVNLNKATLNSYPLPQREYYIIQAYQNHISWAPRRVIYPAKLARHHPNPERNIISD